MYVRSVPYFLKAHKSCQLPDNGKDVGETSRDVQTLGVLGVCSLKGINWSETGWGSKQPGAEGEEDPSTVLTWFVGAWPIVRSVRLVCWWETKVSYTK